MWSALLGTHSVGVHVTILPSQVSFVERVNCELSEMIEKCDAEALAAQVRRGPAGLDLQT